jgi:uncharacterized protein DUF1207
MAKMCGNPRQCRFLLRHFLAVVASTSLIPVSALAQEDASAPTSQRVELPRGIKVELPEGLTKEEAAAILETYARRLRRTAPGEVKAGPLEPRVLVTRDVGTDAAPPAELPRPAAAPADDATAPGETAEADRNLIFDWGANRRLTVLPATLLWQPALANQHEPRMSVKMTTLDTEDFKHVSDFSIGGTMALVRNAPAERADNGVQLDIFAVAISRFVATRDMTALDYRFGVPLTFARGPWSAKLSYEHTSTHLGDEFLNSHPGSHNRSSDREELSLGLAYRALEALRFYGVLTYAFHMGTFVEDASPYRYDLGVEWSRPAPTGWRGQPFAALDLEIRGDEEFTPNFTAQAGWQWIAEAARPGLRLAAEYYDGRSPFGQFIDRHESWVGIGLFFDY